MKTTTLLLLLLLWPQACSFFQSSSSKSQSYQLTYIPEEWIPIEPDLADHAYANPSKSVFFIILSTCKKYDHSSIKYAINNLLGDLEIQETLNSTPLKMKGRKALEMTLKAKIDGVSFYLLIRTLQKNRCTYDFAMISKSLKELQQEKSEFIKVMEQVKID